MIEDDKEMLAEVMKAQKLLTDCFALNKISLEVGINAMLGVIAKMLSLVSSREEFDNVLVILKEFYEEELAGKNESSDL